MKPANKIALILLTFFFGGFGGHKLYVKRYGQAALYLIFVWTGIPALVALVELIIYIIKPEDELANKYPDTLSAGATAGMIIGAIVVVVILMFVVGAVMGMMAGGL